MFLTAVASESSGLILQDHFTQPKINLYFGSFIMQLLYIVVLNARFWECVLSTSSPLLYHHFPWFVILGFKQSFLFKNHTVALECLLPILKQLIYLCEGTKCNWQNPVKFSFELTFYLLYPSHPNVKRDAPLRFPLKMFIISGSFFMGKSQGGLNPREHFWK